MRQILLLLLLPVCLPAALYSEPRGEISRAHPILSLATIWKFQAADRPEFSSTSLDDSAWMPMRLPQNWHMSGVRFDGTAWYRISFRIEEDMKGRMVGIVMPLREGWHELYINGHRLDNLASLEAALPRAHPTIAVPLAIPPQFLNYGGSNVVSVRARSYGGVGGFITRTMYAGDLGQVMNRFSLSLMWYGILVTVFFLNGMTHAITYMGSRADKQFIFFALFSVAIGFIVASIDNLTHYVSDSMLLQHAAAHIGIICAIPLLVLFATSYFGARRKITHWILGIPTFAALAAFALSCTGPAMYGIYIRYVFPAILIFCAFAILYCLYLTVLGIRGDVRGSKIIGLGFAAFGLAAFNDIAAYLQIIRSVNIVEEGFLIFVGAMSFSLSVKYARLQSRLSRLNSRLRVNLKALEKARSGIAESEVKYRSIVESSHQIIFSLDSSGSVTMINQAVGDMLGITAPELIGQDFLALIYYQGDKKNSLQRHTVRQKLGELIESRGEVSFRTDFFTRTREPRELLVKLQYIRAGDDFLISGQASAEMQDELMAICVRERQVYVFGNYVYLSDAISQRLYLGMLKYTDHDAAYALKVCLREMIINAIEHGNLGISFDDKTEAQNEGTYFSLLLSRQMDPRYANRNVTLVYSLTSKRAVFRITDQGDGFDHKDIMARDLSDPEYFSLMHGRGIAMARLEFDTVRYNAAGNSVLLIKKFG